jgi:hypothetical protein
VQHVSAARATAAPATLLSRYVLFIARFTCRICKDGARLPCQRGLARARITAPEGSFHYIGLVFGT